MEDEATRRTMDRALKLLGARAHSAHELATKLARGRDASPEAVRSVLAECRRLNLLDDAAFARDLASEYAARGCGLLRIRLELARRGVAAFDAAEALEQSAAVEDGNAENAARFRAKSLRAGDPPVKNREKLYRFLLSRGFTARAAIEALRKVLP